MFIQRWWPAMLLTLGVLLILLSACSSVSAPQTPAVCPTIPPLPASARQPPPEPDGTCVPTCSAWLSKLLDGLQVEPTATPPPATRPPPTMTP